MGITFPSESPEYRAARDPEFARSLNPQLQNFAMWLETNASRIPM